MPAKSSDNLTGEFTAFKDATVSGELRWRGKLLLLALNFIPLIHVISAVSVGILAPARGPVRIGLACAVLYLLPPTLARLILFVAPITEGQIAVGSHAFFTWWTVFQLQVVFCRIPALEEILRLIPGLYSLWLRLWGARIGRLTYWSPGTLISDRSFLSVGDNVILGAGVRLNSHVLMRPTGQPLQLVLARVTVGDRAVIGGYSLLTAGTEISADESTRAFLISPPFSVWRNGKRIRSPGVPEHE